MTYKSDGKIDTSKLGTNVGDYELIRQMIYHSKAPNSKEVQAVIDGIDKGIRNTWNTITKHPEMITIGTGILIGVTGNPSLGLKIAALPLTNNNKTSGKRNTNSAPVASQTKPTSKLPVKSSTSRGRGRGKMIKFQPTGTNNEWHAYELTDKQIKSQQVTLDVLKQMLKDGVITKAQYNKWH